MLRSLPVAERDNRTAEPARLTHEQGSPLRWIHLVTFDPNHRLFCSFFRQHAVLYSRTAFRPVGRRHRENRFLGNRAGWPRDAEGLNMADAIGIVLLAGCYLVAGVIVERWIMSDIRNHIEDSFTLFPKRLH